MPNSTKALQRDWLAKLLHPTSTAKHLPLQPCLWWSLTRSSASMASQCTVIRPQAMLIFRPTAWLWGYSFLCKSSINKINIKKTYVSNKHWPVSLYISSPVMKMDPKEAKASNFGCSQASDWQCVWNRECEAFSNHSLQLELTVDVFSSPFLISTLRFLRWSWHHFGLQRLVIAHVATTIPAFFPEHSDSCWKCCLIFLIERHEHFYSVYSFIVNYIQIFVCNQLSF